VEIKDKAFSPFHNICCHIGEPFTDGAEVGFSKVIQQISSLE